MNMNIPYGLIEDIGLRDRMEDGHAIYHLPDMEFFSAEIYDGHGGKKAAQVAAEMLTPCFLDLLNKESGKPSENIIKERDLLRQAYLEVDSYIIKTGTESGTTAATFYLLDGRFISANVGDTRVIIGIERGVDLLTSDHRPNLSKEKNRIEKLGGHITGHGVPRVQGTFQ